MKKPSRFLLALLPLIFAAPLLSACKDKRGCGAELDQLLSRSNQAIAHNDADAMRSIATDMDGVLEGVEIDTLRGLPGALRALADQLESPDGPDSPQYKGQVKGWDARVDAATGWCES